MLDSISVLRPEPAVSKPAATTGAAVAARRRQRTAGPAHTRAACSGATPRRDLSTVQPTEFGEIREKRATLHRTNAGDGTPPEIKRRNGVGRQRNVPSATTGAEAGAVWFARSGEPSRPHRGVGPAAAPHAEYRSWVVPLESTKVSARRRCRCTPAPCRFGIGGVGGSSRRSPTRMPPLVRYCWVPASWLSWLV